ncbi:hypothetical protein D9M72_415170 [compost metagenome]
MAIGCAAVGADRFLDDRTQRIVVVRGVGRDHAVAVEAHRREPLAAVGDVGERQRVRVLFSEQVEDAPAFLREVGARRARVVEVVQRQRAAAREQHVGAAQPLAGPLAGRDDFGRSHAAVAVGVDEVERARIEVDAARGAGERDPELLVEFGDARDVLAVAEHHLVHAARAKELPAVRRAGGRGVAGRAGGNGGGGGRQRTESLLMSGRGCRQSKARLHRTGISLDRVAGKP